MKKRKRLQCPSCQHEYLGSLVQAQVDVAMAMEMTKKVIIQDYQKIVLLSGDKDFIPVIDLLRDYRPDLNFSVIGFHQNRSMSSDLLSRSERDCIYYLDEFSGMFFN
jgi:uncharacterized LabA/DUF88 family protein